MNAPGENVLAKVRQWMVYADEDLRLARHALSMEESPYRLVAYHAQQCAEKYLKAYLVLHGVDFPYTHNIARLLELCREHGAEDELTEAEELTAFATTVRYPGEEEQVTRAEAERAVELAESVRSAMRRRLVDLGLT